MTCNDIDNLRDEGRSTHTALLPVAREHLQSCERCRALQAFWDSPVPVVEIPSDVQARIARQIVTGLRPVAPLSSDSVLVGWLLAAVAVAVAIATLSLVPAGWQALAPWQSVAVFPLLGLTTFLVAVLVTRQMVPGARQPISPLIAIVGIFVFLLLAVVLLFPSKPDPDFVRAGLKCWGLGLLAAAGAAALFFPVFRRGAWLSPVKLGASTGCLAGLVGLTVLEIHCPILDGRHIGLWHLGAALTATLLGTVIAAVASSRAERPQLVATP